MEHADAILVVLKFLLGIMDIDWDFVLDLAIFLLHWFTVIYICFKMLDQAQEWLQAWEDQLDLDI